MLTAPYAFGLGRHVALTMWLCQARRTPEAARDAFLWALHREGYRDLRSLNAGSGGPAKTLGVPVSDPSAVAAFIAAHPTTDLYCGVASRGSATGRDLSACTRLFALFVDLDFDKMPEAESRGRLDAFALRAGAVIRSGNGLHCYWFLREAIDLTTEQGRNFARLLLRSLAAHLGGDMASAEPERILRLPGTANHNYSPPRPVVIDRLGGVEAVRRRRFQVRAADPPGSGEAR